MARYTLSPGTTSETVTFSVPNPNQRSFPLAVTMGFGANQNHTLTMTGFGPDSNAFSDGLDIADHHGGLTTLNLQLATDWPRGWGIKVNGTPLPTNPPLEIPSQAQVWVLSIEITVTFTDPKDNQEKTLTTGDPKIKVIRPSS